MWQSFKQLAATNVFPTICYLLAAYFLYAFCHVVGVPPDKPIDASSGSYLALALFLFMLPEAKKLKFGQLFEYEARVKEIKQEVRDFKEETRSTLSAYTSLVSAISNTVSQTINVHLPGQEVVNQAKDDLRQALTTRTEDKPVEDEVEAFLQAAGGDVHYALAKLRMQLERELRRILKKRTTVRTPEGEDTLGTCPPAPCSTSLSKHFLPTSASALLLTMCSGSAMRPYMGRSSPKVMRGRHFPWECRCCQNLVVSVPSELYFGRVVSVAPVQISS